MANLLKSFAYALAGFAMMLNIRLCYSSAPYALIRFKLPENLFSVFVRRMASSLELWCLPSMCLGNIMDFARKRAGAGEAVKKYLITYHSIFWSWANFLTFVILLFVYIPGDHGHLTTFYWVIAASGFVFGINMVLVYAVDAMQLAWYMIGENSFPMLTSIIHYITTLIFGNRRKWNSDYLIVCVDIVVAIIISLVAAALWTAAYGKEEEPASASQTASTQQTCTADGDSHTIACKIARCHVIPPCLMVLVGMGLVYMIYPGIAPGMIVPFFLIDKIEMVLLIATAFPPVIIGIMKSQNISPYVFMGNWGGSHESVTGSSTVNSHDNHKDKCCIGDKVYTWTDKSDMHGWHSFTILIPIKISLAIIFVYCLHHRDSSIARSIINQPKMSTFLSIIFYMCHECLLAAGFPGIAPDEDVLLPMQLIGAFLMVLPAMYSEGYLIEYKSHDPAHWPTEGMTKWNAFCYLQLFVIY